MIKGTDILKCEGGTYIVDYDAEIVYGDRFIWLHKDTGEFYNVVYPSQVSSYIKVKVTWYYEDEDVDNTTLAKNPEEELNEMLRAELGEAIDREIINRLIENTQNIDFTL